MNERIRELADRLWRIHPKDIDAMGLKTRKEFYEQELEKFAELIVRSCSNIAAHHNSLDAAEDIMKHFGVEE